MNWQAVFMSPWRAIAFVFRLGPPPPKPNLCDRCKTKIPTTYDSAMREWHCDKCVVENVKDWAW
jgi:hypothetical protein